MVLTRRKAPQQLGGAIQDLLGRLDAEGHFEIVRLVRAWPAAVGENIARRTEVVGLKFGTALVKVSGAMWLQELTLMKPQILLRLQDAIGSEAIRDLRFLPGRLSRRPRSRLRPIPRNVRLAVELPEMRDPELRRAFDNLIEAWGRSSR